MHAGAHNAPLWSSWTEFIDQLVEKYKAFPTCNKGECNIHTDTDLGMVGGDMVKVHFSGLYIRLPRSTPCESVEFIDADITQDHFLTHTVMRTLQ